jgi:hypothetical protein
MALYQNRVLRRKIVLCEEQILLKRQWSNSKKTKSTGLLMHKGVFLKPVAVQKTVVG